MFRRGWLSWGRHLALLAVLLLGAGCAGTVATPRYTSAPPAGGEDLARELEARQRALRRGDTSGLRGVIDSYLGVPYLWGGTTRAGMDCSALTRAVYREAFGVELPRTSTQMFRLGRPVSGESGLRPGDLVFFRLEASGPGVSHVGIYLGDGRFAHASVDRGGVIDELGSPFFGGRYAGARRVLP